MCAGYTDQLVGLGGRNEGVVSRMANGYFTRRTETCRSVLTMLQQLGVVMMYAPPHSGKTSLCQLVTNMARASSVFQQVYHFGCAAASNTDESFQTQFRSMCGVTFDKAAQQASASNRTVIVIDEAQRFDKTAGCVWGWAKLILSTPTDIMRLMILIALSHGSTPLPSLGYTACPVEFSATRSIRIR